MQPSPKTVKGEEALFHSQVGKSIGDQERQWDTSAPQAGMVTTVFNWSLWGGGAN